MISGGKSSNQCTQPIKSSIYCYLCHSTIPLPYCRKHSRESIHVKRICFGCYINTNNIRYHPARRTYSERGLTPYNYDDIYKGVYIHSVPQKRSISLSLDDDLVLELESHVRMYILLNRVFPSEMSRMILIACLHDMSIYRRSLIRNISHGDKHKCHNLCQLSANDMCCVCADKRVISNYYVLEKCYVDGKGLVDKLVPYHANYCKECVDNVEYLKVCATVDTISNSIEYHFFIF